MIAKKNDEWNKIENEFNSRHGVNNRSLAQLRSLWKNLKSRAKTAVANERREKKKTGGGPAEKSLDKISNIITEMLPQQINSLENPYDDDASFHVDEPTESEEFIVYEEMVPDTPTLKDTTTSSENTSAKTSQEATVSLITSPEAPQKKLKTPVVGRQDQVKSRLLEMAEKEHDQKMKNLLLKEEILILKKQKLENEIKCQCKCNSDNISCRNNVDTDTNNNSSATFWQPYAS